MSRLKRGRARTSFISLIIVSTTACGAPREAADLVRPILYQDGVEGHTLYTAEPGGERIRLEWSDGLGDAAWDPEARRLVFRHEGEDPLEEDPQLEIANLDGTGRRWLGVSGVAPAWSAAGHIAFVRTDPRTLETEIWTVPLDGSPATKVIERPSEVSAREHDGAVVHDRNPAWSPDGSELVFDRELNFGGDIRGGIWTMGADGSDQMRLTDGWNDREPDWSPDAERITFARTAGVVDEEDWYRESIWVMDRDGARPQMLKGFGSSISVGAPAWSPDGNQIAFLHIDERHNARVSEDSVQPALFEIAVINADGSGFRILTASRDARNLDW